MNAREIANSAFSPPAVAVRGVSKSFGALQALVGVDFTVESGEIHALLGENGAGKTTLMNILFGLLRPDAGAIRVFGRPEWMDSPRQAMAAGIGMVHQHFMLVPNLTVAENLFLGMTPPGEGFWLRGGERRRLAREAAERFHILVNVDARVQELSVGEQQRVELLKALVRGARVLILDEPTAALAPQEIDELFGVMDGLRAEGRAIVFISHKLNEVTRICDRVTALRRGRVVGVRRAGEADSRELGELMVGRALDERIDKEPRPADAPCVLRLEALATADGRLRAATFDVRGGEIYAVTGVEGNGQSELAAILSGVARPSAGRVFYGDRDVTRLGPAARGRLGFAMAPGDRRREGLALDFSVAENLILKTFDRRPFARFGVLLSRARREFAQRALERHDIRAASADTPAATLSGGNQQKVVIARELELMDRALAAVNPTRGLDVGAARAVHDELLAARARGAAILLITNELDEALLLADRIGVMFHGRLLDAGAAPFDKARIGRLMLRGE